MSYHDYTMSKKIASKDYPFYALIMASMRKADSYNADKLRAAFPEIWAELKERYNATGGFLPEEIELLGSDKNVKNYYEYENADDEDLDDEFEDLDA